MMSVSGTCNKILGRAEVGQRMLPAHFECISIFYAAMAQANAWGLLLEQTSVEQRRLIVFV